MLWYVKRLRRSKNKVTQRLSAEMGRFINLRKRGKPGKKASIKVRDRYSPSRARLVVGGGRGGRMREAISRSLVVVVMGLGVEGRLGGAPLLAVSMGGVDCHGCGGVSRGLYWKVRRR